MGAAILFPKFFRKLQGIFDGPIRNKMAAQCLLSSISRPLGWIDMRCLVTCVAVASASRLDDKKTWRK